MPYGRKTYSSRSRTRRPAPRRTNSRRRAPARRSTRRSSGGSRTQQLKIVIVQEAPNQAARPPLGQKIDTSVPKKAMF